MADTGAPYFIPYVEPTDLVRDYPAADEASADAIAAALDAIPVLAGIGSNVVQTVKTDVFAAGIGKGVFEPVPGLTATITPTSNTSKILVLVQISFGVTSNSSGTNARVMRGATPIGLGDAVGVRSPSTATGLGLSSDTEGNRTGGNIAITLLDSPGVDTATTYSIEITSGRVVDAGTTMFINRTRADTNNAGVPRAVSTVTLIEVAP